MNFLLSFFLVIVPSPTPTPTPTIYWSLNLLLKNTTLKLSEPAPSPNAFIFWGDNEELFKIYSDGKITFSGKVKKANDDARAKKFIELVERSRLRVLGDCIVDKPAE